MAHSSPRCDPQLQEQLTNSLYKAVTKKNKTILQYVLKWGTPRKKDDQSFYNYLVTVKNYSTKTLRKFIPRQRWKMKHDVITNFDVTLLYSCIQFGCDGLAPPTDKCWTESNDTLEGKLTSIKENRNEFIHEEYEVDLQTFFDKLEIMRDLLNDTLRKAAQLYNIDAKEVENILRELNNDINEIRDKPLSISPGNDLFMERLRQSICNEGKRQLKGRYNRLSSISPCSNLIDEDLSVRVNKIYAKLVIKQDNADLEELLECDNLLELVENVQDASEHCTTVLIEGEAGAGKTTLTRMMISEWASGFSTFKNLTDYELTIWYECRNSDMRSLAQLLRSLMPTVGNRVQSDYQLLRSLEGIKILFLVDGLDELNPSSEQVLKEIISLGKENDITVICTTRPSKISQLKRDMLANSSLVHVKILGIAEENREEFIKNYWLALRGEAESEYIRGLLTYLKREWRLYEHWKLPFNLVLVTVLWFRDPSLVNSMTTGTELLIQTHDLCVRKLKQRLSEHELTRNLNPNTIDEKINKFLTKIFEEAFVNHYNDKVILSRASVQRLKDACDIFRLPPAEVLGSFLIQTGSLMDESQEKYSFPHKALQDFFCAKHIEKPLVTDEMNMDIPRILSGIRMVFLENNVPSSIAQSVLKKNNSMLHEAQQLSLSRSKSLQSVLDDAIKDASVYVEEPQQTENEDFTKWQNVIIHLTELLYRKGGSVPEKTLIELVNLLRKTGIRGNNTWLNLLSKAKCDFSMINYPILTHKITVIDTQIDGFIRAINNADPSSVEINFTQLPDMSEVTSLLSALLDRSWWLYIWFHYDYWHPKESDGSLDSLLQHFFQRSKVKIRGFRGYLSTSAIDSLPSYIENLHLAVKDNIHYQSLLPFLSTIKSRLPKISVLSLHVPASINERILKPLPDVNRVSLGLTIGDEPIEVACRVARALQPSAEKGYDSLNITGFMGSSDSYTRFKTGLSQAGVKTRSVVNTRV